MVALRYRVPGRANSLRQHQAGQNTTAGLARFLAVPHLTGRFHEPNSTLWTEEDNAKIRSLAGKVSLPELARQLTRTEGAIGVQTSKLGIKITVARAATGAAPLSDLY